MAENFKLRYMPQLDSLRAFLLCFVFVHHWIGADHWLDKTPIPFGAMLFFFVLSGFLITQILIASKFNGEAKNERKFHLFKQYYIRRTLRIFPIYYITLFILFAMNFQGIREIFWWFFMYVSNFYFFHIQGWVAYIAPMWSLSVEEQFYLIWPFLILFVRKKYLLPVIVLTVLTGPIFREMMFQFYPKVKLAGILLPSCLDSIGLGALLAYFRTLKSDFKFNKFLTLAFLLINLTFIVLFEFGYFPLYATMFSRLCISLVSVILIAKGSIGFGGILKTILENKFFTYLGKISYALYLFHAFIPLIYAKFKLPPIQNGYLRFLIYYIILIGICSVSWFLIEKPINNLKKKFTY